MKYWGIVSTGLALVMLLAMASLAAAAKIAVVDTAKVVKEYKAQANKPGTLKKDLLNDMKEIIAEIAKNKGHRIIVGFAMETNNELKNATLKKRSKNLDMIVLNSLKDKGAGFGGKTNKVTIIGKKDKIIRGKMKNKTEVAHDILDVIKSDFMNKKG